VEGKKVCTRWSRGAVRESRDGSFDENEGVGKGMQ